MMKTDIVNYVADTVFYANYYHFSDHWIGLQKQPDGLYHWVDSTSSVVGYNNFGRM